MRFQLRCDRLKRYNAKCADLKTSLFAHEVELNCLTAGFLTFLQQVEKSQIGQGQDFQILLFSKMTIIPRKLVKT